MKANYMWLDEFWNEVIGRRNDRRWEVATLIDGDLLLRDGYAHAVLRSQLHGRDDVSYRYVPAWRLDGDQAPPAANVDLLFLGRPKPFASSCLSRFGNSLERVTYGEFGDPNDGRVGGAIKYDKRTFLRHAIDEPFDRYRRCDIDHGIFVYHQQTFEGETRYLCAIAGLGTLGTLGMTIILADERRRARLLSQVRAFAAWRIEHRPDLHVELCVRIEVDPDELPNLLNIVDAGDERSGFQFQAEAVVIGTEGGKPELFLRGAAEIELELRPDGYRGGFVRTTDTQDWVRLPAARFELLRRVVQRPQDATIPGLCSALGIAERARPEKRDSDEKEMQRGRLAKLVHDLNANLRDQVLHGRVAGRLVRYNKIEKRYVLDGIEAVVR